MKEKKPRRSGVSFVRVLKTQAAFRLTAEILPFAPVCVSNETFWFSLNVPRPAASTAEMCTNTSFAPLSGWMNPKPLLGLKNFTVPMVDIVSSQVGVAARTASGIKKRVGGPKKSARGKAGRRNRRQTQSAFDETQYTRIFPFPVNYLPAWRILAQGGRHPWR